MLPLSITVELLINGTWTDISGYVYFRDGINIGGGAVNWGDTPQPAQCTFTVDNRDGRFSPLYAGGAFYPYLTRNVQVRFLVTAVSSSGNFYSGYRFWGEISEWPPLSDPTGTDVYVQVTAHGPLRRINAGGGMGSALTRYYQSLTGALAPAAYWPCEEDPGNTGIIGTGMSGGLNMTVLTGTPSWKAISDFNGSAPIAVLNNSTWDGLTGSFGTSGDDLFLIPGAHPWVASTTTVNCKVKGAGGGGQNGFGKGGNGPGGGEFAQEATLAVTPGTMYIVNVGAGGPGGKLGASGVNNPGGDGQPSSFQGDAVLVLAHGGKAGTSAAPGLGGTGSVNTGHHDGGPGGTGAVASFGPPAGGGGGGGGGSGGTAAPGNAGGNAPTAGSQNGGIGAAAVTGGVAGGHGGRSPDDGGGTSGPPGGGAGAGGGYDPTTGAGHGGFPGGPGSVELVYTPGAAPSNNVVRFILFVPKHGGNNGRVLARALTGGTIARLDVLYVTGGKLQLKGYNNAAALLFTSANLTVGDGQTLLVSAELAVSGANVAWKLTAIVPGAATALGSVSGTQVTATMGSVSEVLAGPNADITKTAMGHFSVQYTLIDITKVSRALNGHDTELSVDRFLRLANEQALDQEPQFNETADHWGFETGTQSWTATNASVSQSAVTVGGTPWSFACNGTPLDPTYFIASTAQVAGPPAIQVGDKFRDTLNSGQRVVRAISPPSSGFCNVSFLPMAAVVMGSTDTVTQVLASGSDPNFPAAWPTEGARSLLITASGAGQPSATSPSGTSGQPVLPGDIVSLAIDVMVPVGLSHVFAGIKWYTAAGAACAHAEDDSADTVLTASTPAVLRVTATAPATAAFFAVTFGDHNADAVNTLIYGDNVRVSPRMGVQTRKEYAAFLKEVQQLDQGILKESKRLWGLGYRTRLAMISQAVAVTLNYAAGMLSPPLAPVVDLQKITNHIVVRRKGGSKITVTLDTGAMSTSEPPAGIGRMKTTAPYAAQADAQLAALAAHLLNLGTASDERYPTISVQLTRASLPGHALAPLMSAVAGVEIGDYVQLTNLPFWYPNATAKQLVIGYSEVLTQFQWDLTWNCTPEAPWEVVATALRRW
jgi:hypothetical protein